MTRSVDVLPTLASLAGIALPESEVEGVDLAPVLRGERPPPDLIAFSHTGIVPPLVLKQMKGWEGFRRHHARSSVDRTWVALRHGDEVLKLAPWDGQPPTPEVYDWARDAGETKNRFDSSNPSHRCMQELLVRYRSLLIEERRRRVDPGDETPERQVELLKSLGYIR